jgi:hypothetical protein
MKDMAEKAQHIGLRTISPYLLAKAVTRLPKAFTKLLSDVATLYAAAVTSRSPRTRAKRLRLRTGIMWRQSAGSRVRSTKSDDDSKSLTITIASVPISRSRRTP